MIRQWLTKIATPALVAAALLFATGPSWAGPHGGGHGGGGHAASHGGGGHGNRGGFGGGYGGYGGYGRGGYGGYGGYGRGYGGYGYGGYGGFYPWFGLGYYPWYGYGSSYYPGYTSYNYYYPDTYTGDSYSYYPPAPAGPTNAALVDVSVPANAEVLIGSKPTSATGSFREFLTPSLTPGKEYSYDITARWMQNGQMVQVTKHVAIHAGDRVNVDFLRN